MSDFSLTKYIQALEGLSGTELKAAVRFLHEYLSNSRLVKNSEAVKRRIDEASKASKNPTSAKGKTHRYPLRGKDTFSNYLYDQGPGRKKPIPIDFDRLEVKENILGYLLFFQEEYHVALACEEGSNNAWRVVGASTGAFVVEHTNRPQAVVYDVFYPRTTTEETDGIFSIGVAKLLIDANGEDAHLVFHFLPVNYRPAYLKGKLEVEPKRNTWYFEFWEEEDRSEKSPWVRFYMTLHAAADYEHRRFLSGVYSTSYRGDGSPVCGVVHLIRNSDTNVEQLYSSEYVDNKNLGGKANRAFQNIPALLYYSLFNARYVVPVKNIKTQNGFLYGHEADTLAKYYIGTYQVYAPGWSNRLKLMRLELSETGVAILREDKDNLSEDRTDKNRIVGYVDYCANHVLIIKFDHQAEQNYWRFSFILERDNTNHNNLKGIFSGLNRTNRIASGRVYLSKAITPEVKTYEPISLSTLNTLFEQDPEAGSFMLERNMNSTDAFWTHWLDNQSQQPTPTMELHRLPSQSPLPITGTYNAFFVTKKDVSKDSFGKAITLTNQLMQLIRMPMHFEGDSARALIDSNRWVDTKIQLDGTRLTLLFTDSDLWGSMVLSIPSPQYRKMKNATYHYGSFTQLKESHPESSGLILYQETDPTYQTHELFESLEEFNAVETHHPGLVSFLLGDYGRFFRMPSFKRAVRAPTLKYPEFRRTFFAAACYYGSVRDIRNCKDNLRRAFQNGFGMYLFGGIDFHHPDFANKVPELVEERRMLREAKSEKGPLAAEELKKLIEDLWKLEHYK